MTVAHESVLGVHLTSGGFGWTMFEGPLSLFDWGTADIRRGGGNKIRARINALFDKYQPLVLVVEEFEGKNAPRTARIGDLYRAIIGDAELRHMQIRRIERDEIRAVLHPARTRYAVACAVAAQLTELKPYLPKKRRIWERERLSMAVFSAAACAIAYHASGP